MLVYRVCGIEEINYIIDNGNFSTIGSLGKSTEANNHNYQYGCNYMHFFLNMHDINYISSEKGSCICTYDIPKEVLDRYCGVGKYIDFIDFKKRTYVVEFAIKSEEMRLEYLKRADVLTTFVNYEDFFNGGLDSSLYETIYDSSKPFLRERKKEESSS